MSNLQRVTTYQYLTNLTDEQTNFSSLSSKNVKYLQQRVVSWCLSVQNGLLQEKYAEKDSLSNLLSVHEATRS